MGKTNFHILNPRDKLCIALLTFTILKHETWASTYTFKENIWMELRNHHKKALFKSKIMKLITTTEQSKYYMKTVVHFLSHCTVFFFSGKLKETRKSVLWRKFERVCSEYASTELPLFNSFCRPLKKLASKCRLSIGFLCWIKNR